MTKSITKSICRPTQRQQCIFLLRELEYLIERVGHTPLTEKILALCTAKLNNPLLLLNEAETEKLALIRKNWIVTLIWVLKFESKALSNNESLFQDTLFVFFEPLARKSHADLLLWEDCLNFLKEFGQPNVMSHNTAVDGWYATTQERMQCAYEQFLGETNKRELIDFRKQEIALLKERQNPCSYNEKPNLYNLIEVAKTIMKPNPSDNNQLKKARREFRVFKWGSYVSTHRKWLERVNGTDKVSNLKEEEITPVLTHVEDGKFQAIINGRQKQTLFPLPSPSFLKQPRKKTLTIGSL